MLVTCHVVIRICPNGNERILDEILRATPTRARRTINKDFPLCDVKGTCKKHPKTAMCRFSSALSSVLAIRIRDRFRSNSVSWNPHKMLGVPLQCSFFLVKGKNALHEANCAGAKYLFQQDKFYDVTWDTGDKSVQCGRKVIRLYLIQIRDIPIAKTVFQQSRQNIPSFLAQATR